MESIEVSGNNNAQADASVSTNVSATSTFTADSVLNDLQNACINRTYQSFKDIQPGEYIVNFFSIVDTKHGVRIRIDMAQEFMLLPERFAKTLTAEKISLLNLKPKIMVYGGKDSTNRDRLILTFREADEFISGLYNCLDEEDVLIK